MCMLPGFGGISHRTRSFYIGAFHARPWPFEKASLGQLLLLLAAKVFFFLISEKWDLLGLVFESFACRRSRFLQRFLTFFRCAGQVRKNSNTWFLFFRWSHCRKISIVLCTIRKFVNRRNNVMQTMRPKIMRNFRREIDESLKWSASEFRIFPRKNVIFFRDKK